MGYKRRQQVRKANAARIREQKASRATGTSAGKWWLTPIKRPASCNRCGGALRPGVGRNCVYRRVPETIYCCICAENLQISYRPSLRWEQAAAKARGSKASPRRQS